MEGKNTQTEEKTFSQEDVNRIVGERLAKEKYKLESELAEREQELKRSELRLKARELLNERGLPASLIEALSFSDEASMSRSISVVEEALKPRKIKNPPPPVNGAPASDTEDSRIREAMGLS